MLDEPRAGRLTAWGNAQLDGRVAPDDAAAAIAGGEQHRIVDLPTDAELAAEAESPSRGDAVQRPAEQRPAEREREEHSLAWGLGRLRALGARQLRLALPVPGHPLGLTGPAEFNQHALEAGEAVLTLGGPPLGLLPEVRVPAPHPEADRRTRRLATRVLWRCARVREGFPTDVPALWEAERELAEALREATATLSGMDVSGAGEETQQALAALRERGGGRRLLAPGYPARAVRVLEQAQRIQAVLRLAEADPGGAVSASDFQARAAALRPLGRVVRRAQVAAYNAHAERAGQGER